jgi:hypothetical protein
MVFAAPCILREIGVIPISRWVIATNPTPNAYHCRGRARRGRGCEEPWAHDLQLISLGEVLSALAAELAGKPPDSHRSKPFKSASSGHDSRAILRYRMSTTKSKRAVNTWAKRQLLIRPQPRRDELLAYAPHDCGLEHPRNGCPEAHRVARPRRGRGA